MNRTIKLQVRSAYGVERIYPRCETSNWLVILTGRKTFLTQDLEILNQLGYEIEWVPSSIDFDHEPKKV